MFKPATPGLASLQNKCPARFAVPLTSTELQRACTKFTCANTKKNNTWATKVFDDWLSECNKTAQQTFPDVLQSRLTIDRVLSAFVLESRRKDGESYPPNTLRNILAPLFRVMMETFGPGNIVSFMDNKVRGQKEYINLALSQVVRGTYPDRYSMAPKTTPEVLWIRQLEKL